MHSLSSMHGALDYLLAKSDASRARRGETRSYRPGTHTLDLPVWTTGEALAKALCPTPADRHYYCCRRIPPSLRMPWRPALLGRFCRERGRSCQDSDAIADPTLAGGEGQIHYLLLRRHAFLFVQPLATYVLIIGQDEAFVQVSKLRRSVLSHN